MIQFGRLLSFPMAFKNLEEKVSAVNIQKYNISKTADGGILVDGTLNNHHVQFLVLDPKLKINSRVAVYCDCEFFKYNLAYGLNQQNSLLNPELFDLRHPKTHNPTLALSGCKHLIALSRDLFKHPSHYHSL